ncbi:diguanylate cyclase [Rheinheimera sp. MMS21-TC3]|uniref:tetratricopeptide repeat-containing diguanylate cyclase n=1 Tax=Rheinheimera sp. MMS21-TC3 TaxID=3072790 RepID=UPI0028C4EC81|nr:diguanylate cyclase [Rheinheimera sp. MMS21-TC3]WNO62231.1 diguanylate cyclase [Rheinheimera sp. MMS21-TC3]
MMVRHYFVYTLLLLFSLFLSTAFAQAQEGDVDPKLEQQLDKYVELSQNDRESSMALIAELAETSSLNPALQSRARLLGYLSTNAYFAKDFELSNKLLQQLLKIAAETENQNIHSEVYATEIELLMFQQKLNDAVINSEQAELALEQATDPRVRFYAHNVLGRLFQTDSKYEKALQHYIGALDAVSETDNAAKLRRRAFLNYNIALVHTELKNWSESRQITEELLADAIKYQFNDYLPQLYLLLGYISNAEKNFTEAIKVYEQGLEVVVNANIEGLVLIFENNIGAAYIELEQYAAAKKVLLKALPLAEKLADENLQHLIRMNLGFIKVMDGEHAEGIAQMQTNLAYFEHNGTKSQYESFYEWLPKAYAAAGMYKQQVESLLLLMQLREDIRSTDRESRLNELQNRYDNKSKAQTIILLEQENKLKAELLTNKQLQQKLMLLIVLLILFTGVGLWQLYRKVRRSNLKLNETNKQLALQSQRDPLTGLYNRRALQQYMEKRSKQGLREKDNNLSLTGLLLLDIDFFKRINDHYGHSVGDAVLIELSQRLQATCRTEDLIVRWGGEEILLLLNDISASKIADFIQRVLQVIAEQPVEFKKHSINVTASGGFIHLPFSGVSEELLNWEKVLQIADMALYLSKANGRNQVCMINGLAVSYEQAESLLYTDLASAIRKGMVKVSTVTGPGGNVS